jgi:hypothetical protein
MKVWVAQCPARTAASPAMQAGHLGGRTGFVEEDPSVDPLAHTRLAMRLPRVNRLAHILAIGL